MEDVLKEKLENAGFDVTDPIDVDLSNVKEERRLVPAANNILLRIRKVTARSNPSGTYRSLNISFQLENGIEIGGEVKYRGTVVFESVCYHADATVYTKDFFKKRQHLVALTQLMKALGRDMNFKIDDEFLSSLEGQAVIGSITQKPNNYTTKDGVEVKTIVNAVNRFKAVPTTDLV